MKRTTLGQPLMVQSERAIVTTTAEIFFECKEKDRVLVT
jgi:hypothetical protein